jgi:hypothetical protein
LLEVFEPYTPIQQVLAELLLTDSGASAAIQINRGLFNVEAAVLGLLEFRVPSILQLTLAGPQGHFGAKPESFQIHWIIIIILDADAA